MEKKDLQQKFDEQKWLDSEASNQDTCGTYDFCKDCNKEEEYPCASAKLKNKPKTTKAPAAKKTTKTPAKKK